MEEFQRIVLFKFNGIGVLIVVCEIKSSDLFWEKVKTKNFLS